MRLLIIKINNLLIHQFVKFDLIIDYFILNCDFAIIFISKMTFLLNIF
jgi:hypothetical protein